ncbi:MAG: hypothetical protein DCC56_02125 [Anaerolineae bacterium]|nr:MAG: hypothetical protein DCC56_02125 [Anaerolineae bacterium]WKZ44834.1 MAG: hypothetical protein QY302_03460 [Anaerolineales bacterium]
MKTISIFLALINSITAGILLLLTLSSVEVEPFQILWLIAKTVAGTIVILIGIVTWLGGAGAARSGLLPMSSLFLVALGAATTVWTFHIGIVTGDLQYHMVWYGGSLLAQGVTSLAGLAGESKNLIAS